ncbi:MAG: hypothetical protein KDJ54_14885 [Candidatus Competibacteraceae bacterium]|nr:hypothetical protein [Candidatus Competibacteraceae bacterium]
MKLLTLNWLSSKGFPVPRIAASTLYAVLVVSLGLLLLPDLASAEPSFALDTILPSGLTDKPFLEQVVTILAMVILSAVFIALGFGVVGGMTDIFTTLSEARRMGDWGLFMKNLGMVLGVVILGVVLAVLVYTWMTTISINPTVTIGS